MNIFLRNLNNNLTSKMEVEEDLYNFGQELLNNFDKERANKILSDKTKELEQKLEQEEDSLLRPTDKDALGDKYSKWDKIDQTIKKREHFEQKAEKDKSDLNKNLMEQMMGCSQNHSKEMAIYNRSFNEKIEVITDFKEKGNQYFNQNDLQKASYFYEQALLQFHYLIPDNKEEEDITNPLHVKCHLNKAICLYKQKRYQEAIENTYQALNIDPNNTKGLYRQAL